jgi:UDP-GlcNAc:undecaprenyl-phosphate/decaprenyl-phosphate GlcNAc-1-phosphate transferase
VAIFVVAMGYRFRSVGIPFGSGMLELGFFSYPITVIWIVGVTNAINLIDGMDGLSGTISGVVSICFAAFFYLRGDYASAVLCCIFVGAIGGFLAFNKPKASIFMGDGGALFLGFVLATLPLLNRSQGPSEIGLLSAITALLIPIYDTFAAILRRKRAHVSFFTPDKEHLHHKLLDLGLSAYQVLGVILVAALALGAAALSPVYLDKVGSFCVMVGSWIVVLGLFLVLHYNKERRKKDSANPTA